MSKQKKWLIGAVVWVCAAVAGCDLFVDTQTRIERAEKSMETSDYRAALIELKNVLQKEPDNARAHLDLAEVAFQLGDVPEADQELKRAHELAGNQPLPTGKGTPDPTDLQTRIRISSGKNAEVLADIDGGKLALPAAARSLYRAQVLLNLGRAAEAQTEFLAVLKADPKSLPASIGLAQSYAFQNNPEQSLKTLEAALAQHPDSAKAWVSKATVLAAMGRGTEVEQALEKANANAGQLTLEQQAKLLVALTSARLRRGDIDGAQKLHESLVAFTGEAPATRILAAQIAVARKDYDSAAAELHRLLQSAPDFIAARVLLAEVLLLQNRPEQAELHLSQAVEKAPDNLPARQLLSKVRKQLGRPDPELAPAARKPVLDPRIAKAMEYQQAGQKEKAIAEYEKVLAEHPGVIGVLNNLAWLYYETGNPKALETAKRAYLGAPKMPAVADTYGWILFKSGHQEEGLKVLEAAAKSSKDPEVQKHYAEARSTAGK